ncbi:hypothetical protein OG949_41120 (plasmid) [Streptomyces scopuliridis]|uniref:hypothetical protein n=1 Tax=Streptomyces scopuliridis TaxID=452529 RepID=UPI002DDAF528|nr:hypothetical protein [Streptomyces scopuliridis]WSB39144.1 hypothetical protein OG949_41120 [Streptomyces scopuliridis]
MAIEGDRAAQKRTLLDRLYGGRERSEPIPTPWPELTELAELTHRHKVGIIAQRGSREAKVGRDIAVHAARAGVPTVLYTGYPPATIPDALAVDETPNPTAAEVNQRAKRLIGGQKPGFIVIERYERLHPAPRPSTDRDDPVDDPCDEPDDPLSWADQLMWSVRDIRTGIPMLFTTVVTSDPDLSLRLPQWLHVDHPAMVMTDVCKPTLVVLRKDPRTVEARLEVDPHEYRAGSRALLSWAPLTVQP